MNNEELTKKVIELDERATSHTEQIKTLFKQSGEIKDIAKSVHELATTVRLLASNQERSNKKMDKISSEIEEIKEKPAKRWESVVTNVIVAIITALITYALTAAGLK